MQRTRRTVVVLGTGGTIAGISDTADDLAYRAGVLPVRALVAGAADRRSDLETEQVAQVDSKDMDAAVWRRLAVRVAHHLARDEVMGVVVTHGTDTLEETAYFLQRVLAPAKPVVLTAAMRPATSRDADGPRNLRDAITVARDPGISGVVVEMAGDVHAARAVRKVHTTRVDAFASGEGGPIARVVDDRVERLERPPREKAGPDASPAEAGRGPGVGPAHARFGLDLLTADAADWPVVEIVVSHAGARGALVDAACAAGASGIVVAATGNGTLHHALETALRRARTRGVVVWRATRWIGGAIVDADAAALPSAGDLTPVQARIELMLRLMRDRTARAAVPGT